MLNIPTISSIVDHDYDEVRRQLARHGEAKAAGESPFILTMIAHEAQDALNRARRHLDAKLNARWN